MPCPCLPIMHEGACRVRNLAQQLPPPICCLPTHLWLQGRWAGAGLLPGAGRCGGQQRQAPTRADAPLFTHQGALWWLLYKPSLHAFVSLCIACLTSLPSHCLPAHLPLHHALPVCPAGPHRASGSCRSAAHRAAGQAGAHQRCGHAGGRHRCPGAPGGMVGACVSSNSVLCVLT